MRAKYKIGQTVKLATDPHNLPRIVTKYEVSKLGINYCLACGCEISWHSDVEIQPNTDKKEKIGLVKG